MTRAELVRAREELLANVRDGILPFWRERAFDEQYGGFVTELDGNGDRLAGEHDKRLVMQARLVWCFSTFAPLAPEPARVLELARRGVDFLIENFHDDRHGGWFWQVARDGEPVDTTKHLYGQSFAIYGLSAFARATDDSRARELVTETIDVLERRARDQRNGGFFEHFTRSWVRDGRLAGSRKTLDAHLHLLEAFSEVCRLSGLPADAARLRDIADVIRLKMIGVDRDPAGDQFSARFQPCVPVRMWEVAEPARLQRVRRFVGNATRRGRPVVPPGRITNLTSYGHSVELAWLLADADRLLGDEGRSDAWIVALARHSLERGHDAQRGGLYRHGPSDSSPTDTDKWFWPNAEGLVGFLAAHHVTRDEAYLRAFLATWRFAREHLVHPTLGEWRTCVTASGEPIDDHLGGPWKAGYHTGRAALESVRRIDALVAT